MSENRTTEILQDVYNPPKSCLDVCVQDQTTPPLVAYFSLLEHETFLAADTAINDLSFTVTDSTGFSIGDYLSLFSVIANRFYLASILGIAGNIISLDTPLDFAYLTGDFVTAGTRNMNVNGDVTPVIFGVRNTEEAIGSAFDITRVIFSCLADGVVDLSKFGDLDALIKGVVLRRKNGIYQNVFNAKTNGELKNLMFDFDILSAINPAQGQNGFTGRLTFAGQNKMGVAIRLEPGEDLQIIIQDDLTDLIEFTAISEGHLVD